MNYMSEIAKMLGVELGEEFEIIFPNSNCRAIALLNNERLYIKEHNVANQDHWQLSALTYLLNGSYTIKRKPWKPQKGDTYYFIDMLGQPILFGGYREDNLLNVLHFKIGNCYKTRKEAEANRDKWIAFYKSDEVLEV